MAIEKKPGLYLMPWFGRKETIDVYWSDSDQRWFYGRGADCGNVMTDADWEELDYIGPVTPEYLTMVDGLTRCQGLD
jgi:hypothetical protein